MKNQSRHGSSAQANVLQKCRRGSTRGVTTLSQKAAIFGLVLLTFSPIAACGQEILPEIPQEVPIPQKRPDVLVAPERFGPLPQKSEVQTEPPIIHRNSCPALRAGLFEGKLAPPLRDGECGENSPVEMLSAGGVQLPGKPLVNCAMATELVSVIETAKTLARDILGADLKSIVTGPGYECRRRNRAETGKLSEHAFANALDVAEFVLSDKRRVSVEKYWPHLPQPVGQTEGEGEDQTPPEGNGDAKPLPPAANGSAKPLPPAERAETAEAKFLVGLHDAACQRFTTVLGPDANAEHHAHFHFDLGCHGRTCTYLICE
jgi:hypothetical protein